MANLPERQELFEGKTQLKGKGTKDYLDGEAIKIKAYAIGNKDGKDFAVMLFEHNGKELTGAFGPAVLQRLTEAEAKIGVETKGKEKYFKEVIDATITKVDSKNDREYFTIN